VGELILGRLLHFDFADAKALPVGQHGNEAVQFAVELQFVAHDAFHGARAATQVVELLLGHHLHEAMEARAAHSLERAAGARPAMRNDHVALLEAGQQGADLARVDLMIGGQGDDHIARGLFETGHQRGGFAEVSRQRDDRERFAFAA
jgi:hypothetical protein